MLDFFNQTVERPSQILFCLNKVLAGFDREVDRCNQTVENRYQTLVFYNKALFRFYELIIGFNKEIVEPAKILAQAEG